MSLVSNILDRHGINASLPQVEEFEKWLVNKAWNDYKEDKMNKKLIIENEVKALPGLRFPNGTVNKHYEANIEIPKSLIEDAWIEGLDATGLSWSLEETRPSLLEELTKSDRQLETFFFDYKDGDAKFILTIKGKPLQPGDFTIELGFKYKGWQEGEEISYINLPIAFNPDPRTLWKNIPTPESILFYKKDYEVDYIKVSGTIETGPKKDIVAASQRGRSHAQEGKPRDDHFKLYHCDSSDWYIIAVADGAGSAKFSREGSRIACETVVNYCRENLINSEAFEEKIRGYKNAANEEAARKIIADDVYAIVGKAAFIAQKGINEASRNIAKDIEGTKVKDFATTLMFAICKKFEFGWFIASYWVGDGAMCLFNKEKKTFKLLGKPDEGEYSGQTRFLTMPEIFKDGKTIMDRLRFSIEDDFTALLLMTDGVSDPMFETDNNLNSFDKWDEFWNKIKNGFPDDNIPGVDLSDDNEESKFQLLQWLDFWSPGNHDDRTIAILY